jgi:hypothetical protein
MYRSFVHLPRHLLLTAMLAGLGTVALAQSAAPAAAASVPATVPHRHGTPEQWHERMAQRRAQRMADLKAALAITPDQESAWSQFEAAMQPPVMPQSSDERGQGGEWAKLTTPERIDRMEQRMADRQQHFKQMGEAIKAFYGQLTPKQQKIFDERAMRFAQEHAQGQFGWHGKRGAVPRVRHHPLAQPEAPASQAQ